jgi:formylglycine-generating enzyme required for sulfatase activity
VEIPADFCLGKYEVTQEEWEKVMGENPSWYSRTGMGKNVVKDVGDRDLKRFLVEFVSWHACHGNVWELCDDGETLPDGTVHRVIRGGAFETPADNF